MRQVSWIFRLCVTLALSGLAVAAITAGIVPHVFNATRAHEQTAIELPLFSVLAQRSYVYDALGNEIYYFQQQNTQPVRLADVSPTAITAILAVEDREFYRHKGVNLRALTRALLNNVQAGSSQQGASTVTQQLVKLEFLSGPAIREDGGRYKLLQARYAVLLERKHSKEEILERYLNSVYFGNNAYGIQAAAEVYFGKKAADLTIVESAFLAGLIKKPSGYDPVRNPEPSRARFREVMKIMSETLSDAGKPLIDPVQATALASSWALPSKAQKLRTRQNVDTFFTEMVRDYLLDGSEILGKTREERESQLYRGGLKIYTTFDPGVQFAAEVAKGTQLPANKAGVEAAMVSVDTKTGALKAMVGGQPFVRKKNELNLALATRQTGSSIKIFILAAAVQAGAQPDDLVEGTRGCVLPNPGEPNKPFEIRDGAAGGLFPLKRQTASSINCAFARLSQIVGLYRVVDTARRMGVKSPLQPFASFATGANEVSPWDMASGAQTIANHGLHKETYFIERIDGPKGVIFQHADKGTQVLTPAAADTVAQMMKGVLTDGTARRIKGLEGGRPAAGKTGTQQNNTNAWFVGFTRQYTTAVWVGDPKSYLTEMTVRRVPEFGPQLRAWGNDTVVGGTFPAQIWKTFMDPIHTGLPFEDWPNPEPARPAARLYLPGEECLARSARRTSSAPTTTEAPSADSAPGGTEASEEPDYRPIDSDTTIPPTNLDPLAPLPSAPAGVYVYSCAKGLPKPKPRPAPTPATTTPGSTKPDVGGPTTTKAPKPTTTDAPKPTTTEAPKPTTSG